MTRLSRYLARLFAADGLALFAVALFLLFLIQCLRTFDVVSVKGQGLLTLLGQAVLTMPALGIVFLYVCLGIGLARGLRTLQQTHELHIIHASRRTGALLAAIGVYAGLGVVAVVLLTNFVEPTTNKQVSQWSASIAADLVGRTLTPHRFAEVVPGVTMVIGGRQQGGELVDFFADDNRSPSVRRTYSAKSALVTSDSEGYVLQLRDGAIQYMSGEGQFSEVSFRRYDIALERLTGSSDAVDAASERNSYELVMAALEQGGIDGTTLQLLGKRMSEGLRVIALCLFVTALAAFPDGRRGRRQLPIEIVVLGAAFLERGISSSFPMPELLVPLSGSYLLAIGSLLVLLVRLRVFTPVHRRELPA